MKNLLLVGLLFFSGCALFNSNRALFGKNVVGSNVELGKKSIEASMVIYKDAETSSEIGQHTSVANQCIDESSSS